MSDGPETRSLGDSHDADGPTLSSELQRKITEIGQGYLAELKGGRSPDRGALVSANPEVSPFLDQHLR